MRASMRVWMVVALSWTGSLLGAGCGDDEATGTGGAGGAGAGTASTAADATGTSSSGPTSTASAGTGGGTAGAAGGGAGGDGAGGGGAGAGGNGGAAATAAEVIAAFDPASFAFPEGLALRGDEALVGFAFTGAIDAVSLDDGAVASFAALPPPPPNTSFVTGLALAPDGDLLAALVSFTDDAEPGLYRIGNDGGAATLWASHPDLVFPNGMAFDEEGLLYFTDSVAGGVFTADEDGLVAPWATDEVLGGDPTVCGGSEDDIAVGANGIVWTADAVYVAGSDHGVVVRFPIGSAGEAGAAEIVAGPDCEALAGLDGLALDADGTLVGAVNRADRLVRIDPASGDVTTLFEGAPLDFPASVAFEEDGSLLVTSFALDGALSGGEAAPALVHVTFGD